MLAKARSPADNGRPGADRAVRASDEVVQALQSVIDVVVPVFGLIACGYLVGRTPLLTAERLKGLTNFVFYIAIPALLFRTLGHGLPGDRLDLDVVYAYFGAAALLFVAAMVLARLGFRLSFTEQALFAMGTVFSNTVMLGIPLVYTAFGEAGMAPVTLIVAFHSLLLIGVPTLLIEIGRGKGAGIGPVLAAVGGSLVRNPVIVALVVGLAWGGLALPVPDLLDRFIGLLSGAAAPCALVALGASLAAFRLGGNLPESIVITDLKLIVHPLLVWLLAVHVFELTPMWQAVAVLVAALPVGANVFVLAQSYDIYVARAASSVLISTAISVFSVAVLLAWLGPAAP